MRRRRWLRLVATVAAVAAVATVAACDDDDGAPASAPTSAPAEDTGPPAGVEPEAGWFTVWPELEPSVLEQDRWTGSLTGSLWRRAPDPWLLCRVVEESFPPGCEYGVPIAGEPSAVGDAAVPIESTSAVEWTDVTIEISGAFDPVAIVFIEAP